MPMERGGIRQLWRYVHVLHSMRHAPCCTHLLPLDAQRPLQPLLKVVAEVAGRHVARAEHGLRPLRGDAPLAGAQACGQG